ncbi:hypothetical protein [Burkholderia pseudomallei]|uniref:hypothetical protein n=1 Tax=Burkholderia pseudomallei TaxID=28450 RepID=UPI00016AF27A|nr:hypothetical protein [Burkholderia pseudomallei]AJX82575.1 hypothetical protein BG97_3223 [Burkholderia pseudomallei 7894]ARK68837.1 hypothetical protein BOC38_20725 [Burkholderia pseudomallei]ARL08087.1 hypothetical protein BOC45_03980 [Burkholderia pseudomallei]OMQ68903.1 hypothetical protein AQ713_15115 [Burkholderia pseudomallei]
MAEADFTRDDKALDELYEQVLHCEPAIAPQDVGPLADLVMNQEQVGRNWRLTAMIAGKGGEFYRELAVNADHAQTFAPVTLCLRDFAKLLRQVADLADSASARIMVAGCNHEHFNDWVNEPA